MPSKNPAEDIAKFAPEELFSAMEKTAAPATPSSEKYYSKYHEEHIKDIEHRREQRERFDNRVFWLLVCQVAFLIVLISLQGFKVFGFSLNDWAFGIFVNGSLIQSFLLVRYIAADLYTEPKNTK